MGSSSLSEGAAGACRKICKEGQHRTGTSRVGLSKSSADRRLALVFGWFCLLIVISYTLRFD